jgi:hypothetical protein
MEDDPPPLFLFEETFHGPTNFILPKYEDKPFLETGGCGTTLKYPVMSLSEQP